MAALAAKLHKASLNCNFLHATLNDFFNLLFPFFFLFFSIFYSSTTFLFFSFVSSFLQQSSPTQSTGSSSVKSSCAWRGGTGSEPVSSDVFRYEISKGRLYHIWCYGKIKTGKEKVQIDFVFSLSFSRLLLLIFPTLLPSILYQFIASCAIRNNNSTWG